MKLGNALAAAWVVTAIAWGIFGFGFGMRVAAQPGRVEQVRMLPICTYTLQERDESGWITVKTWTRRCDAPSNSRGSTGIGGCGRIIEEIGP
jgi:hypothetical protein